MEGMYSVHCQESKWKATREVVQSTYSVRRVRGRLDDRHVLRTLSGKYK
jgi:hypothetical protein